MKETLKKFGTDYVSDIVGALIELVLWAVGVGGLYLLYLATDKFNINLGVTAILGIFWYLFIAVLINPLREKLMIRDDDVVTYSERYDYIFPWFWIISGIISPIFTIAFMTFANIILVGFFIVVAGLIDVIAFVFTLGKIKPKKRKDKAKKNRQQYNEQENIGKIEDLRSDYDVLGVHFGCSIDELRKAYRYKANMYHPDKVGHLPANLRKAYEEEFCVLQESYQRLMAQYKNEKSSV